MGAPYGFGSGYGDALLGKKKPGGAAAPPSGGGGRGGKKKPQGINAWAQAQANKYIAAQIAAIQESQKLYLDELNKAAQERVKQGQALASWMQGQNFPGRVQGLYQTAGSDITGYAGGFGGEMRDIANADAAQQANMLSGTGQEGAIRNEGQGMSDVLYGAYGWSPAKKFAETGAAYASDAALQPGFAAQFAQAEAIKQQQEGMSALKDFALKMAEAKSGKLDLVSDFTKMRQGAQDAAFDRKMEVLKWQSDEHYRRYLIYEKQGNMKMAQQELALAQRKQRQAEIEQNRQYGLDVRQENRLGKAGSASGGLTPTQKKNAIKDITALDVGADIKVAVSNGEWYVGSGPPVPGARQKLHNRIFAKYRHLTMGNPEAKRRLHKVINQALDAAMKGGGNAPAAGSSGANPDDYID